MIIFRFGPEVGKRITLYDSNFIMSRIVITDKPAHIGCMHLEAGDVIGLHEATSLQLLLIVHGQGSVRGDSEEEVHVASGDAVFWRKGEWHETKTEHGLMAIVVESDELNPAQFMPSRSGR
ncbi:MAG: cupin domain-containing protein [Alicyclobacillus sp.]|nr:cupin domain-containing protein [Alicyclobacillus sp.]